MNMLSPFGMLNPKPHVLVENAVLEDVRKIGANKTHVKMTIRNESSQLDCVGFNKGELEEGIVPGSRISIVGEMSINEWNNRKKPQLMIKDAAVSEWQLFDLRGKRTWEDTVSALPSAKRAIVSFKEDSTTLLQTEGLAEKCTSSAQKIKQRRLTSMVHILYYWIRRLRWTCSHVCWKERRPSGYILFFSIMRTTFYQLFPQETTLNGIMRSC